MYLEKFLFSNIFSEMDIVYNFQLEQLLFKILYERPQLYLFYLVQY